MSIETRPLTDLDDARRLLDLVYSAYGLTYHRSFMYDADELLALNRRGQIRSILAKDDDGSIVGHIATIRPWFESLPSEVMETLPTSVEIGLSIVHPGHRGRNLQTSLGIAALMHERDVNPGLRNMFGKCLTVHSHSQRAARDMCGRASALLLGSVPSWVQHDHGSRPSPMTTVVLQSPCVADTRRMYVPAVHEPLLRELVGANVLGRTVAGVAPGEGQLRGGTRCSRWFEPSRRRGIVHVWEPGEDLVHRVLEETRWLVDGHMEHVTVLLPIDAPGVAGAAPQLEEAGLFFGGFLPDIEGRDMLVLEHLSWQALELDGINLLGEEARKLGEVVLEGWRRCHDAASRRAS